MVREMTNERREELEHILYNLTKGKFPDKEAFSLARVGAINSRIHLFQGYIRVSVDGRTDDKYRDIEEAIGLLGQNKQDTELGMIDGMTMDLSLDKGAGRALRLSPPVINKEQITELEAIHDRVIGRFGGREKVPPYDFAQYVAFDEAKKELPENKAVDVTAEPAGRISRAAALIMLLRAHDLLKGEFRQEEILRVYGEILDHLGFPKERGRKGPE